MRISQALKSYHCAIFTEPSNFSQVGNFYSRCYLDFWKRCQLESGKLLEYEWVSNDREKKDINNTLNQDIFTPIFKSTRIFILYRLTDVGPGVKENELLDASKLEALL